VGQPPPQRKTGWREVDRIGGAISQVSPMICWFAHWLLGYLSEALPGKPAAVVVN
jgi:hypothetical protein